MVLSRIDENELLTALYSSVFEGERPWQVFLSRLRARVEADQSALFMRPAWEAEWRLVDSVRAAPSTGALSLMLPPFDDLRVGRVYASAELGMQGDVQARYLRLAVPDKGDLVLSVQRNDQAFRARDAALLSSLLPHLAIAFRSRTEMDRERRRSRLSRNILSRLSTGWLLLSARGRILDGDAATMTLIEDGRVIRRGADGHIHLANPEAEALLAGVLASREGPDVPCAAWLDFDPPLQMVLMRPPEGGGGAEALARPHCLMLLRAAPDEKALGDGRHLPALFRLTRSEAALAARLAEGRSLAEAAQILGLTIETARNYSKHVYFKTGARGQADLVRIVLGGVSMFG